MERKIGEIFEFGGEWYQCMKSNTCNDCAFYHSSCGSITGKGFCRHDFRKDATNVIFKKLEKVGEPYTHYCPSGRIIYFQRYKLFYKLYSHNTEYIMCDFNEDGIVSIEIKQKQEDMEEKTIKIKKEDIKVGSKVIYLPSNRPYVITEANCRMKYDGDWHDCVIYTPLYDSPYKCFVRPIKDFAQNFVLDSAEEEKHSNLENTEKNLKPFNLEAAKAGKPVCTRDGRKARIICFDKKCLDEQILIVLVDCGKEESIYFYTTDGKCIDDFSSFDLMMSIEKKEGWAVIIRSDIYETEEQAKEVLLNSRVGVMIRKIEWEE